MVQLHALPVDLAPRQVYTKLLDQETYLGSLSMFYRVLEENKQVKERRRLAKHPLRAVPELVATAPGQVDTSDITKLAGPVKGKYFECYMMVDIHSRFIVGAILVRFFHNKAASLASPGVDELRWLKPVRPGMFHPTDALLCRHGRHGANLTAGSCTQQLKSSTKTRKWWPP